MTERPPAVACARCDGLILAGEPRTIMSLRLTAGFDGYIPEPGPDETLEAALEACATLSAETLEEGVDARRVYTLCPPCCVHISANPLQRADRGGPSGKPH